MAELTPMMQQYYAVKERNPDCLLFFRLGDFYEMFEEDARIASRELDLTLTSRDHAKDKSAEDKIPMCGVPYHSSESYIARLVAKGYKVAICEQMEDPALAKGLVKRDIIRIVTPGSVTESSMLVESKNNYYACVYGTAGTYGLCFCDVSTGAFSATQVSGADAMQDVQNELGSFLPSEALLGGTAAEDGALADFLRDRFHTCVNLGTDAQFDSALCEAAVTAQFSQSPEALGLANMPCVIAAAGALLTTLRDLQKNELPHIRALELYIAGKFMQLDLAARRNLELTETMRAKEKRGSLLWVLDKTKTAMGGRLLRAWMERPLLSPAQITRRLTAVEELVKKTIDREELILSLREITDFERAMTRIMTGTASCRDLAALSQGAASLPAVKERLSGMRSPYLQTLFEQLDTLADLKEKIDATIVDDPPFLLREGGLIRDGANKELDELRAVQSGGKGMLTQIEAREKEKTGIRNLRVGYNRVFGYYIEVAKGQLNLVPDSYIRKQTLSTGERYITEELKELESTILTAKDRIVALEYDLFVAPASSRRRRLSRSWTCCAALPPSPSIIITASPRSISAMPSPSRRAAIQSSSRCSKTRCSCRTTRCLARRTAARPSSPARTWPVNRPICGRWRSSSSWRRWARSSRHSRRTSASSTGCSRASARQTIWPPASRHSWSR